MNKILTAKNLNIYYKKGLLSKDKKYIIKNFNFEIRPNQLIGLTGESGKGKTTLGKTLLGLHRYYEGEIYWRNDLLNNKTIKNLKTKYTWLGQESFLMFNPNKRIICILKETLKVIYKDKYTNKDMDELLKAQCSLFKLEPILLDRFPFELSAGQIQRFALIRNFLVKPDFIVLDEPISSLDPYNSKIFLDILEEYFNENILSILFISHKKTLLKNITDNIIEL